VSRQESELSCICVLGVCILPLYAFFLLDFGTVPTVWYFMGFFHFISTIFLLDFRTFPTMLSFFFAFHFIITCGKQKTRYL
jgi:hypothetical protein